MPIADLRDWIERLEDAGELDRVKVEVDWSEEIGAITGIVRESTGHALLFENIKDYQQARSRRVFTNLATPKQLAMVLGRPEGATAKDLVSWVRHEFQGRLKPVEVPTGPVKQSILRGDDVNLHDIPVPKWNPGDGGRYMLTDCGVVTRDPDSGWLNVGLYRGMIGDRNRIPVSLVMTQHWGLHFQKHIERKQPMPVAVFFGGDPLLSYLSATPSAPAGVCEYDIAGAMRGEPVKVVKCETSDLLVPADSEIVVEGYIDPSPAALMPEGPFREYTSYYSPAATPKRAIQVTCITHRDDAIFQGGLGTASGQPNVLPIFGSAFAWNLLESAGVPGVLDVWEPPIGAQKYVIVQIHKTYRGQAKQVAAALWGTTASQTAFKHVMVVEEDIDIRNHAQLDWAMTFRINAAENNIVIFPGTPGNFLDPSMAPKDRDVLKYGCGKWARVLFDCTRNWEHTPMPPPISFTDSKDSLPRPWEEYGL